MKATRGYYLATILIVASALLNIWMWSVTPPWAPALDERGRTIAYKLGFLMGQCQAACILHTGDADTCTAQFSYTAIPPALPYREPCDKYMRTVLP